VKPDLILINLSKDSYLSDIGFKAIPDWLINPNIKINIVENTGSYRKLLPALEFADDKDLIVTADDDILYATNWLKNLLKFSTSEPDSIVCCRARLMKKNIIRNWQNYTKWDLINEKMKGNNILPTGGAGAVYKKKLLDVDFLSDHMFLEIAPTTDDLWFRMASLRMNTPVAVFPEIGYQNIYLLHRLGLEQENILKPKNASVSFYFPFYKKWMKFLDYIGKNQSKNDFAWASICKYSQSVQGK